MQATKNQWFEEIKKRCNIMDEEEENENLE
jgi:hypothetical protein